MIMSARLVPAQYADLMLWRVQQTELHQVVEVGGDFLGDLAISFFAFQRRQCSIQRLSTRLLFDFLSERFVPEKWIDR